MNLEITNRYVYVVSDIHNDASGFKEFLDKIAFSKDDLLIINGDIFDRGDEPVDLVNLANWIREQPYFINLDLKGTKYQIAHAETYDTPERIWDITEKKL